MFNQVAGTVIPVGISRKYFVDLWMMYWFTGIIRHKILFGNISHIFRLIAFRKQVVERLVLFGANIFRNRFIPVVGIVKYRINIKHHTAKWIYPVLDYLSNLISSASHNQGSTNSRYQLGTRNICRLAATYPIRQTVF